MASSEPTIRTALTQPSDIVSIAEGDFQVLEQCGSAQVPGIAHRYVRDAESACVMAPTTYQRIRLLLLLCEIAPSAEL